MDAVKEFIRDHFNITEHMGCCNDKNELRNQLSEIWKDLLTQSPDQRENLLVLEHILKTSWEEIHRKKHDIHQRHALRVASVLKVFGLSSKGDLQYEIQKECLKTCDIALIMSPDTQDKFLSSLAQMIHDLIPKTDNQLNNKDLTSIPRPEIALSSQIESRSSIDVMFFLYEFLRPGKPLFIPKLVSEWPAVNPHSGRKWTLSRLKNLAGHRTVPVEIGSRYTDEKWSQSFMTIGDFIDKHINKMNVIEPETAYIAQVNLFDVIPALRSDFSIPDLTAVSLQSDDTDEDDDSSSLEINAWFGPEGTVSPLHFDDKDNILTQVLGSKYVRLYSKDIPSEMIRPRADYLMRNTSQIDIDLLDENEANEKMHLLRELFSHQGKLFMREVVLDEGDALFIPKRTWHFVKSLSPSFSISFWWT